MKKTYALFFIILLVGIFIIQPKAQGQDQAPYYKTIEHFFELIKNQKVGQAVDFIYSDNPWVKRKPDAIQNVREKLSGATSYVGDYLGYEFMQERNIANRFTQITYMVLYQRQPAIFSFKFYRPKGKWRIQGFSFDFDLYEMVDKAVKKSLFSQKP